MKILVTGGCGFIGSNFVRFLLSETDHEIINVDALTYAANPDASKNFSNNIKDINDARHTFIKHDICDSNAMNKITQNVDWIVHFAAESHVDRSINSSEVFLHTNILGTKVLLDAALRNKIKKFLFISTDEVYGTIKE